MADYTAARLNMVESQVRPNRVTDTRVLGALLDVPRELSLPERLRGVAYVDEDLPVAPGRYLMEPMVFARLLQTARIKPIDTALEIGGAPGFWGAGVPHARPPPAGPGGSPGNAPPPEGPPARP